MTLTPFQTWLDFKYWLEGKRLHITTFFRQFLLMNYIEKVSFDSEHVIDSGVMPILDYCIYAS